MRRKEGSRERKGQVSYFVCLVMSQSRTWLNVAGMHACAQRSDGLYDCTRDVGSAEMTKKKHFVRERERGKEDSSLSALERVSPHQLSSPRRACVATFIEKRRPSKPDPGAGGSPSLARPSLGERVIRSPAPVIPIRRFHSVGEKEPRRRRVVFVVSCFD